MRSLRSRRRSALGVAGLVAGAAVAMGMASGAAYMRVIDTNGKPVPGSSTARGHLGADGWTEINRLSLSDNGAGPRAPLPELRIDKAYDAATPFLFATAGSERHIPELTIDVCNDGDPGACPVQVIFKDVAPLSASIQVSGTGAQEALTLAPAEVILKYTSGNVTVIRGWNYVDNQPASLTQQ